MKIRSLNLIVVLSLTTLIGAANAATFTVTTAASDGAGSFSKAIRDADASADLVNTIRFNIPGVGPHYIVPPVGGFPLLTKDNTTIDGYSQPGSSVNTRAITQTNNAVIKIVLDARAPNANFRLMEYVYYGSTVVSDPVINNAAMYGDGVNRERGGYDPGEVAILGIYRATNVTVKGLAFLSDGQGADYAIAVAQDYGLDTAVRGIFGYDEGSSRGFHLSGCWIGYDPATGAEHLSGAALAAFRHRDKGTGGTRPELPNLENFSIGVKPKSTNPRAQFNVMGALGLTIAAEGMRCTVAGNQFLGPADSEIGRYSDTQVPSIVFGTDGDGVNDADEGNLFPATSPLFYSTSDKVYVFAGNIFGLARDGSRPNASKFTVDEFNLSARTKARFGSNFDGLNDALEGNTVYDTLGFTGSKAAPDNNAWILMRGNSLINNVALPMDETLGLSTFDKFIDTTGANPITPAISAVTTASLSGTCGLPLPGVAQVVVDIYVADPEGDAQTIPTPQGKTYLGSFADNGAADSNPAVGAFTFNIASLGLSSGTKITITANYLKADGGGQTSPFSTSATVTAGPGHFVVTTTASNGAGSFSQAIRDVDASAALINTISFNIPGVGPHYIVPPVGGFPLLTKDNTTIDGYSQPGSSVNTRAITQTNNAVIKIVLDARAPNANFRLMEYVYYGSTVVSDPVINNAAMYGDGVNRERGGYDPGEVAILGIYRATNVTVKGLAFLSDGQGADYAIAVAQDYGLDTAVRGIFGYDEGSSRGFHLSGCWIGYDPATGAEHLSGAALAAFRHRDKGTGGTRPELPNLENFSIGVKPKSTNPRAQFNVMGALGLTIAAEGMRCTVAGNQFLGPADSEIGRYSDTQVPSIVFGTDGDGVNDADEGNLFPATSPLFYSTSDKVYVFAGNIFGLARDGSRPNASKFTVDEFNLSARTKARFGSNFDGLNDALEGNTVYDTLGFTGSKAAPDNNAWILMRGNSLINNVALPMDETLGLSTFDKFIDTTGANPITPAISAVTTASLSGTCGLPLPGVAQVVVDIYVADPEGDAQTIPTPQGKTYLGSFADNGAADSNPAVGAFTFNIASLGLSSGTKITITANYLKATGGPTLTSIARSGGSTTLSFGGGTGPYNILRSSTVNGTYTSFASAPSSPALFADPAPMSFYRVGGAGGSGGGQTSPFAASVAVP